MSAKNKWFDPRKTEPLLPVGSFKTVSRVQPGEAALLITVLGRRHVPTEVRDFFDVLQRLPEVIRLKRNIAAVLELLATGSTELYRRNERRHLASLLTHGVPQTDQAVAYALLNTHERYQASQAMASMFRLARARREDDHA